MRAFILLIILSALVGVELTGTPPAAAHELLPKILVEYLAAHPDATGEEISAFAKTATPEFYRGLGNNEVLLNALNSQSTSFFDNALDFIKLGVEHILGGLDHILFVLSLLLVFVSLRELLKLTSIFTLAHSLTLLLAGFGVVTVSPRIVEPVIAFSIAYVAVSSVFFKNWEFVKGAKSKILAVFFFGLFHGLGFAGLLRELNLPDNMFIPSVLFFNLGIEIGQLFIIGLALPAIYFFRNKKWYARVIRFLAVALGTVGLYWGAVRLVG